MKETLITIFALVLSGCVVVQPKASIGSPIEEIIELYGPDYKIIEKKNGRRAYEWTVTETIDNPGGITIEKSNTEHKKNGWEVTTSASITIPTRGFTTKHTCRYKYNTRYKQERSAWIVTSIEKSGGGC